MKLYVIDVRYKDGYGLNQNYWKIVESRDLEIANEIRNREILALRSLDSTVSAEIIKWRPPKSFRI